MNIQEMKDTLTKLREKQKVAVKAYNEASWENAVDMIDSIYERSQLIREYSDEIQMMENVK